MVSESLYFLYEIELLSYLLSFFGIAGFLLTQGILGLRLPKFKLGKISTSNKQIYSEKTIKKEPIINQDIIRSNKKSLLNKNANLSTYNDKNFSSPSLEILDENNNSKSSKISKDTIDQNSSLLESVFADFNIEVKVINVKLGPVITLYEIIPAAGIKISTIINLAGDISRSMGVGAVRIAQIYGTQYLGVEVRMEKEKKLQLKSC